LDRGYKERFFMTTALVVPVMKNFKGLAKLINSVDTPVLPMVMNNWDHNYGVGPAWNEGIRRAVEQGCDSIVIVNDDVVMSPGLISRLINPLQGDTVLVSPQNITGVCHPRGLNFWCYAISSSFVDRFGFFDENYAPAYYEDDDMAYRIKLGGGKIKTLNEFIYHEVQGTQNLDDEPVAGRDVWDRNLKYYSDKWGGHPGSERFRSPFNNRSMTIKDW
jgi:hypothetical protein